MTEKPAILVSLDAVAEICGEDLRNRWLKHGFAERQSGWNAGIVLVSAGVNLLVANGADPVEAVHALYNLADQLAAPAPKREKKPEPK